MGKAIFWLFGIAFLVLHHSGAVGAQNQAEGKKLYGTYCSTCHGEKGKGDGLAAKSLPVKPADHTNGSIMNQLSDNYIRNIAEPPYKALDKAIGK